MVVGPQVVHGKLVLNVGPVGHLILVVGNVFGNTIVFHIITHRIHKVLDARVAPNVTVAINQGLCVSIFSSCFKCFVLLLFFQSVSFVIFGFIILAPLSPKLDHSI